MEKESSCADVCGDTSKDHVPTAYDQNVVIGKAMDTTLERLNEIELKLQQKMTKVCQDQTEDIVRQTGHIMEEEVHEASGYAKEKVIRR